MLILSHKATDVIQIGENIFVRILAIKSHSGPQRFCVKVGIDAPTSIGIKRLTFAEYLKRILKVK